MQNQVVQKLRGAVSPALRDSFSLVITSFVNKCGAIGFNLLPMLVVEKGLTAAQGSFVLGTVKTTALIGTFLGGYSSDRWGLRITLILSFLLTAIGFGLLPITNWIIVITLLASLAQIGHSMYPSAARMMLAEIHGPQKLQEGIAWLRAANNGGQIVSYSISALFSALGTLFFFYIDAATSFIACIMAYLFLHEPKRKSTIDKSEKLNLEKFLMYFRGKNIKPRLFLLCTIIISIYFFCFELIIVGIAAKSQLLYKEQGLQFMSWFMIINTVLCTIFAIPASRMFHNIKHAFIGGATLTCTGGIIALTNTPGPTHLFAGAFFISFGEILFTSMAQYALLINTPDSSKKGSIYSTSLFIQKMGGITAGFIALPLLVYADYAKIVFPLIALVLFSFMKIFFRLINKSEAKSLLLEESL